MKRKVVKPPAKKPVTKTYLVACAKDLAEKLEWATKIIQDQKQEMERLMAENRKLLDTIHNLSERD